MCSPRADSDGVERTAQIEAALTRTRVQKKLRVCFACMHGVGSIVRGRIGGQIESRRSRLAEGAKQAGAHRIGHARSPAFRVQTVSQVVSTGGLPSPASTCLLPRHPAFPPQGAPLPPAAGSATLLPSCGQLSATHCHPRPFRKFLQSSAAEAIGRERSQKTK